VRPSLHKLSQSWAHVLRRHLANRSISSVLFSKSFPGAICLIACIKSSTTRDDNDDVDDHTFKTRWYSTDIALTISSCSNEKNYAGTTTHIVYSPPCVIGSMKDFKISKGSFQRGELSDAVMRRRLLRLECLTCEPWYSFTDVSLIWTRWVFSFCRCDP
jgi:hypothetical protein